MIVRASKFEPCGQTTYAEVNSMVMRENANIVRQYGVVPETLLRKLINTSLSEIAFKLNLFETTSLYQVVLHAFAHKDRNNRSVLENAPVNDILATPETIEQPLVIDLKEAAYFDIDVANGWQPYVLQGIPNINFGGNFHAYDWAIRYSAFTPSRLEKVPADRTNQITGKSFPRWSKILRIQSVQSLYYKKIGPGIKRTATEINSLAYSANMVYDREIAWDYSDGIITMYAGREVHATVDPVIPDPVPVNWRPYNDELYTIVARRRPVLDDLLTPLNNDATQNPELYSQTYYKPIDLPDEHLSILLLDMKKRLFEYYGQPFPADMEGKLQMAIRNIVEGDTTNTQKELEERQVRNV